MLHDDKSLWAYETQLNPPEEDPKPDASVPQKYSTPQNAPHATLHVQTQYHTAHLTLLHVNPVSAFAIHLW